MQKYQDVVLSRQGNPIQGAKVTVTDTLGGSVAIYATNAIGDNVNPVTSDADGRFSFYAPDGRYNLSVSIGGNVVATVTDILLEDPLDGSDAVFGDVTIDNLTVTGDETLRTDLASTSATKGADLVGTDGGGTVQDYVTANGPIRADLASPAAGKGAEMVATGVHTFSTVAQALAAIDWAQQQHPQGVHFLRYVPVAEWSKIANGTSTDDMAAYLVAAFNAVRDAGGGTLILPEGRFYVSTAALQWKPSVNATTVNIKGAGTKSTTILKHGTSTDAVLNLSVDMVGNGVYSTLSDFQVAGSATCNAITATLLARLQTRNLRLVNSAVGFDAVGTLICDHYNPAFESNAIGFRCRASGSYYPNLVQFFGGVLLNNTTTGADIGEAQNVFFHGIDVEFNGTAGNTSTAGLIIRSTCGTFAQHSNIAFNGAWFESNTGAAQLLVEDATYLSMALRDVPFNINPSNKAMTVGAIRSLVVDSCSNNPFGSEYNIGAVQGLTLRGGACSVVNNAAVHWIYENVIVNNTLVPYRRGGAGLGTLNARADRQNSGTSNVNAPTSGTPVTLFTVSGSGPRMILVFACLGGAGAGYTANARFAWDGSNLVRMGGENAANMTLTASGANVQATQISGVAQTINYTTQVIGS